MCQHAHDIGESDAAARLADAYGTTTDCLSGRRPGRIRAPT